MQNAVKALPHYTYDDYLNLEGQWEIIDGIPYAMSPAPIPTHQYVAGAIHSEFHFALKKCKRCKVFQPIDYKVEDDIILQPDMLVVCGDVKKKFLDFPPQLVLEILSPATADKDRFVKYPIYESQRIPYYLIINPDTKETEVYEFENSSYQLKQKGKGFTYTFLFAQGCEATIDFSEI